MILPWLILRYELLKNHEEIMCNYNKSTDCFYIKVLLAMQSKAVFIYVSVFGYLYAYMTDHITMC